MRNIVGIDIGKKGALAILSKKREFISIYDMPNFMKKDGLLEIRDIVKDNIIYIETPISLSGQNNTLTNQYFGMVYAICIAYAFEVYRVAPEVWIAHYGIGGDKKKHIRLAKELYFGIPIVRHDRADALLIARYGAYIEKIKSKRKS